MPRRIANGLTLLSAVVCVGSAMLVGRSFFRMDAGDMRIEADRGVGANTIDGRLHLWHRRFAPIPGYEHPAYPVSSYYSRNASEARYGDGQVWRQMAKVRWLSLGWYIEKRQQHVILPLWLLPLLTAIPPVRWYRARRRAGGRGFAVEGSAPGGGIRFDPNGSPVILPSPAARDHFL